MSMSRRSEGLAKDAASTDESNTDATPVTTSATSSSLSSSTFSSTTSVTAPPSSTLSTSTTSTALTPSSSTSTATISSTPIEWGPAITASPFPALQTAGSDGTSAHLARHGSTGLSKGQKQALVATTVIGGVLIIVILIYALCRRRRGASVHDILHIRRHHPSTIRLSPTPDAERLTALPIYREERYSVRSSKHASMVSAPKSARRTADVPAQVAERFHAHNPYVRNLWKTANPPTAPGTPMKEGHSFSVDATPPPPQLRQPDHAQMAIDRHSTRSRMTMQSSGDTTKSGLAISIRETPADDMDHSMGIDSPTSKHNLGDRWSWTNSQAPTTPRMYAPSLRSSISSLPRFRTIRSWVRGQSERIVEEERPITAQTMKKPMLRNKASLPTLAPPITRRLSKAKRKSGRTASFSSVFKQRQDAQPPTPMSPRLQEQRLDTAASIEMSERPK